MRAAASSANRRQPGRLRRRRRAHAVPGRQTRSRQDDRAGIEVDGVANARRQVFPEQWRRFGDVAVRATAMLDACAPARTPSPSARARHTSQSSTCRSAARRQGVVRSGRRIRRPSDESLQQLLQIGQRVKKVCLHRAHRAAENARDLVVRQLMIDAQDQRRTLFPREPRDRGSHFCRAFRPEQRRVGQFRCRVAVLVAAPAPRFAAS